MYRVYIENVSTEMDHVSYIMDPVRTSVIETKEFQAFVTASILFFECRFTDRIDETKIFSNFIWILCQR